MLRLQGCREEPTLRGLDTIHGRTSEGTWPSIRDLTCGSSDSPVLTFRTIFLQLKPFGTVPLTLARQTSTFPFPGDIKPHTLTPLHARMHATGAAGRMHGRQCAERSFLIPRGPAARSEARHVEAALLPALPVVSPQARCAAIVRKDRQLSLKRPRGVNTLCNGRAHHDAHRRLHAAI